jgi:hypothetical protein
VKRELPGVTLGETGTFGDTFGAANALFSALGVAGVAYALILQHREQHDARRDAAQARERETLRAEESRRQADASQAESERARLEHAELTMLSTLLTAHHANLQNLLSIQQSNIERYQRLGHIGACNIMIRRFNDFNLPYLVESRRLMEAAYQRLGLPFPEDFPGTPVYPDPPDEDGAEE